MRSPLHSTRRGRSVRRSRTLATPRRASAAARAGPTPLNVVVGRASSSVLVKDLLVEDVLGEGALTA
jgi:hypothetical protein